MIHYELLIICKGDEFFRGRVSLDHVPIEQLQKQILYSEDDPELIAGDYIIPRGKGRKLLKELGFFCDWKNVRFLLSAYAD